MDKNFKDEFDKLSEDSLYNKGKETNSKSNSSKNIIQNKGTRVDTVRIKHRAYEILSKNFSTKYLIQCLTEEFGLKERTCYNYIRDIGIEIKKDYEDRIPYLRENIVNRLFTIMDTSTNNFEIMKAMDILIRLIGLDKQEDNSPKEDVKYIIELREDDIEEKKNEDNEDDGNE